VLNGAEPVHADTIRRFGETFAGYGFDPKAAFPAYGMAEATLLISGSKRGAGHVTRPVDRTMLQSGTAVAPVKPADAQVLVGCGRALVNERIAIVDPDSRRRMPADHVGEVWVHGPNTARAYWRNAEASAT
jgi:acyl-CoA synthetase (AMP-forming)/AMP-acid ligase II